MQIDNKVSRRSVIMAGCSAALVGCDSPRSSNLGSNPYTSSNLPTLEQFEIFLTIASYALPGVGFFAGRIGLFGAAAFLKNAGVWADRAGYVVDFIQLLNQQRMQRFVPPISNVISRPYITPTVRTVNDFNYLPVFTDAVSVKLGVINEQGGNFGPNDIYATIKRVDEAPPKTLNEVWGDGSLPHVIISPATNGNYDGRLDIGKMDPGVYVSYSWTVTRGQTPSDEYIASSAFIGPSFICMDQSNYSINVSQAIQDNNNIEARYRLPNQT